MHARRGVVGVGDRGFPLPLTRHLVELLVSDILLSATSAPIGIKLCGNALSNSIANR